MFKLLSKENIIRCQGGRDVVPGFVTYVNKNKPVLMHCYGWQDYSDAYDDYVISISRDNGNSWSQPYLHWKSVNTEKGKVRYGEPAVFFDSDTEKLFALTNKTLYPDDKLDVDVESTVVQEMYCPWNNSWSERKELTELKPRKPRSC